MRIRGVLAFAVVLVAAAVGLAAMATGGAGQQSAAQERQERPAGPPDGMGRGGFGWRGGPGGPGGPGMGREFSRLNLTSDQLDQVKSLMEPQRTAMESYRTAIQDADKQIRDLANTGEFNEAAVRALAQTEAAAMIELRVQGAKTHAAIFKLLTPEQQKALTDADAQAPRRGGFGRRGR